MTGNTAYMALKIILECDEYALQAFVERNQELNQDISTEVLKSDFESILKKRFVKFYSHFVPNELLLVQGFLRF